MPLKSHLAADVPASSKENNAISLIASFALGSLCGWIAKASLPEVLFDFNDKLKLYAEAPSHVVRFKRPETIEACVSDVESALEAVRAGINSLELCVNRVEGGVTPSSAFIQHVSKLVEDRGNGVAVNVLIRPRPGSFVYSEEEFELLTEEVQMAVVSGATGIVTGVLTPEGKIHVPRMHIIRKLTKGLVLTFHRAFDVCKEDPAEALQILHELGVDRLLSSGRMDRATDPQACFLLSQLHDLSVQLAAQGGVSGSSEAVQVVAGAGIKPDNVGPFLHSCGVTAVHCGSGITSKRYQTYQTTGEVSTITSSPSPSPLPLPSDESVATGASSSLVSPSPPASLGEGEMMTWDVVSRRKARALCQAAHEAWQSRGDAAIPFMPTAAATVEGGVAPPNTTDSSGDVHVVLPPAARTKPQVSYIVVDEDLNEQQHSDSPPPSHHDHTPPLS